MSGTGQAGTQPRRRVLRRQERLNGIDYVEIGEDRRTLKVVLFRSPPESLTPANFLITGGVRVRNPAVTEIRLIEPSDPDLERAVRLVFARPGDTSTYRLQLRDVSGFDPRYARIDFTFGDNVDQRLDCLPGPDAPEPTPPSPELDYLAKDYAGFRRLAFDRLAQTMPTWRERHVPDVAVMLVEMMAYVGDHISYHQDAVATEAYLGTARMRTSVRRHARLIDYTMHEGCNARVWMHLATFQDISFDGCDIRFAVGYANPPLVEFAPVDPGPRHLFRELNEIEFYAWGDGDCRLTRGATVATLCDAWTAGDSRTARRLDGLAVGQALLIEAVPRAEGAEPDPLQRHVVRLTHVTRSEDPLHDIPVVEIHWSAEDALPFAATLPPPAGDPPPGTQPVDVVVVARGNMVLADHGRQVEEIIPGREQKTPAALAAFAPGPRRPSLRERGLTFREPLHPVAPASLAVRQDPRRAVAQVLSLQCRPDPQQTRSDDDEGWWSVRPDLIESAAEDLHFVVEMDDDGVAVLRFGDGVRGAAPADDPMQVTYRVGNGPAGNVGAETITRVLDSRGVDVAGVSARNPLPATGGTSPESVADVKLFAPHLFRVQRERAVTADDYASAAEEVFGVRRAAADIVQLGALRLVRVAILALQGDDPSHQLLHRVRAHLHRRRRIGHDVQVGVAQMVALDVAITVGVRGTYLRGHVLAALRDVLGPGMRSDGQPGLFHPDQMSFGTPVHGSRIVAAAQSVTGVEWVQLTRLRRVEDAAPEDRTGLAQAAISLVLGRFEVARMDNDSAHPERGHLEIMLLGGR